MTKKQRQYNGERIVSERNGARALGRPHAKKKKKKTNLGTELTSFTKVNFKMDH